jgi:hypothetical protein
MGSPLRSVCFRLEWQPRGSCRRWWRAERLACGTQGSTTCQSLALSFSRSSSRRVPSVANATVTATIPGRPALDRSRARHHRRLHRRTRRRLVHRCPPRARPARARLPRAHPARAHRRRLRRTPPVRRRVIAAWAELAPARPRRRVPLCRRAIRAPPAWPAMRAFRRGMAVPVTLAPVEARGARAAMQAPVLRRDKQIGCRRRVLYCSPSHR